MFHPVASESCSQAVCTVKNPDDGQRNCPKHVDLHSKNKFQKLLRLFGIITKIFLDARLHELQIPSFYSYLYRALF
jgi:hypothetical protein